MHTALQGRKRKCRSKDGIPDNQRGAQSNGPPKHCLRRAASLRCALHLPVPPSDVRVRRVHVGHELTDVILLRTEMGDERLLEGRDLEKRLFRIPVQRRK